jgi:hypothetical protein
MAIPNMVNNSAFTCILDGKHYTLLRDQLPHHVSVTDLMQAASRGDKAFILSVVDKIQSIQNYAGGRVEIKGGVLFYKGQQLHSYLADKIVDMHNMGAPIEGYIRFLKRLMTNPTIRCREHLYEFLEYGNMPIDEDGYFYAYKYVADDYYDCHSHTYLNYPGRTIEMPRHKVNDDPDRGCESGLHVGTLQYVRNSSKIVIVKVNPRDVCAVPYCCSHQKVRTCKYQVIEDFRGAPMEHVYIKSKGGEVEDIDYINDEELTGNL